MYTNDSKGSNENNDKLTMSGRKNSQSLKIK